MSGIIIIKNRHCEEPKSWGKCKNLPCFWFCGPFQKHQESCVWGRCTYWVPASGQCSLPSCCHWRSFCSHWASLNASEYPSNARAPPLLALARGNTCTHRLSSTKGLPTLVFFDWDFVHIWNRAHILENVLFASFTTHMLSKKDASLNWVLAQDNLIPFFISRHSSNLALMSCQLSKRVICRYMSEHFQVMSTAWPSKSAKEWELRESIIWQGAFTSSDTQWRFLQCFDRYS